MMIAKILAGLLGLGGHSAIFALGTDLTRDQC